MAFQMHPVLRQMKSFRSTDDTDFPQVEGEGLARLHLPPEQHPRVQLKKDSSEAAIPKVNLFRDQPGEEAEEMRDLKFKAGRLIDIEKNKVLQDTDFEKDESTGVSSAQAHLAAANLVSAYEQTVKEEVNFQKSFNNNVRTLLAREEVTIGLMHLWDFVEAYIHNPNSKCLTTQLFLIVQHIKNQGIFKDTLLNIADIESKWLYDLINILQSIVVQETTLTISEKVAAINFSIISLGKYYAKKIFNSPFVPLDKEVKIQTFYMRMVLKILVLSDDLGVYRNDKIEKIVSNSRKREFSDDELLFSLRKAFLHPSQTCEDDSIDTSFFSEQHATHPESNADPYHGKTRMATGF
ncbi:52K [Bat mastadenovirus WIV12]|uniref:52K n=1 Tax=Bat mastadenovirus WIV12 TaxID=1788434 RepID=A0A1B0UHY9_9ADEN|nr:52K [Bat mastadenovirus WIV12]AMB43150.1 52K [Bat mastadenovirus WIV12]